MTAHAKHAYNFQQGWLDLLKRHGVTAGIALFLVYQMGGNVSKNMDALSTRLEAHAMESDKKLQAILDLLGTVVKGQDTDRAIAREQLKQLRLHCLRLSKNDEQREECMK